MKYGIVNKPGMKYVLNCSLVWSIVLPAGLISGWIVREVLSNFVPFYKIEWIPFVGLILGCSLSGANTIRGLRRWIPDIKRKQIVITSICCGIAMASILIPSIIFSFD